jgi:hypothetical protein
MLATVPVATPWDWHHLGMVDLLIAGLPGAGKTTYCQWLRENHGYHHIDVDSGADPDISNRLGDDRPGAVVVTARRIRDKGPNVVLDWGFPPPLLPIVRQLGYEKIELWWFGGDEEAAHQSFTARRTVAEDAHRVQIEGIRRRWTQITKVFDGRMLDVISPGPTFLPPESIYNLMFPQTSRP